MEYKTPQAAEIVGLKQNYIKQLIHRGYIWPSHRAGGPGKQHGWTLEDLYRLKIFRTLMSYGLKAEEAGELAMYFPKEHLTPIDWKPGRKYSRETRGYYSGKDDHVFFLREDEKWHVVQTFETPDWGMKAGRLYYAVDFPEFVEEIDALLAFNLYQLKWQVHDGIAKVTS